MIALYMRLSGADGDLDGEKAESNSISNQRKILRDYVKAAPDLACQEIREFVDDGFSGSNFDRPDVQRMLEMCKSDQVDTIVVKDLSRFAREYIDAGTYIEQVFPFLRVRFISIAEGYDSAHSNMDRSAPAIAIRNIANAAYCRDTSIRIQSTMHTRWRRGQRPHAMPPFGYMVDPEDRMKLAIDERFAPSARRVFELAIELKDPKAVAAKLTEEGIDRPGIAYRKHKLYGFEKRPEPKTKQWSSTQVQKIITDPVYKGTLVAGKTHRLVMSKKACRPVDESERYVTEGAHPALVSDRDWNAAQSCVRVREYLKGMKHSEPRSPFTNGFVVRAECGHSCRPHKRKYTDDFYACECDCAAGDERIVTDVEIADALAAALRESGISKSKATKTKKKPAEERRKKSSVEQLEAYERYVNGTATIEDYRSLGSAPIPSLHESASSKLLADNPAKEKGELLSALEEHRLEDVDRKLLRRLVSKVLVHEGGRLEVRLDRRSYTAI